MAKNDTVRAVRWEDGAVVLLDQRRLPEAEEYLRLETAEAVAGAIREMVVRGAPAIGITAAYGVVLAARAAFREAGADWPRRIGPQLRILEAARPTAVNLRWAIGRMRAAFDGIPGNPEAPLLDLARRIHEEDIAGNRRMGALGAALIRGGVLTHCNTGSLATGGHGTALGVVRSAWADGRIDAVYATETRPWLQGARLTAWELRRDGIPATLIADSAAAALMRTGRIQAVIVGADRIAANGDVVNKVGTYALAVAAAAHGIPFMVVAPTSTIDPETPTGEAITIEERDAAEITAFRGTPVAPSGVAAYNPVFDMTPARLVRWLVTEKGVVEAPDAASINAFLDRG